MMFRSVDLLPKVHGEGLRGTAGELTQPLLGRFSLERLGHLREQILGDLIDDLSRGEPVTAAAGLGHGAHHHLNKILHLERAESEIRIGVQTENLRRVLRRERLDRLAEILHSLTVGHGVSGYNTLSFSRTPWLKYLAA